MKRYAKSLASNRKTDAPVNLNKAGDKSVQPLNRKGTDRYKTSYRPSKRSAY